jgi:hypothetical protein
MKTKLLLGAGALSVVALFAFKTYPGGSLSLPPAVTSLFSSSTSKPMKRDFPGYRDTSVASVALPEDGGTTELAQAGTPVASTNAPDAPAFSEEDVNARIARAMALSKTLAADAGPAGGKLDAGVKPATAAPAKALFAGEWIGKFLGPDAGTMELDIDDSGIVVGEGVSTLTGIRIPLSGKIQSNGHLELTQAVAAGGAATGAAFKGTLTPLGKGTGTWEMASYNISGTWELAVTGR